MIFGWRGDRKEISEMIGTGRRILKIAFPMESNMNRYQDNVWDALYQLHSMLDIENHTNFGHGSKPVWQL